MLPAGELGLAWTSGARAHDESRRTVQKAAGRAPPAGGETAGPCLPAVWETLDLLPYMIWQLPRAAFVQYPLLCRGLWLDRALGRKNEFEDPNF